MLLLQVCPTLQAVSPHPLLCPSELDIHQYTTFQSSCRPPWATALVCSSSCLLTVVSDSLMLMKMQWRKSTNTCAYLYLDHSRKGNVKGHGKYSRMGMLLWCILYLLPWCAVNEIIRAPLQPRVSLPLDDAKNAVHMHSYGSPNPAHAKNPPALVRPWVGLFQTLSPAPTSALSPLACPKTSFSKTGATATTAIASTLA
jgi:hypothetical protein